jgi:ubiquinone/menaquinone biosynthesis C-methylase UbiE
MIASTKEGAARTSPVKPYKGLGMEGRIAKWYAATTRHRMDEFKALVRRVAEGLPPGGSVLEVAPGPGYAAIEMAKLGDYRVAGLDISRTMVEIARDNAREAGVEVDFRLGNASGMPFEDGTFDRLFCSAAFKNFTEPVRAIQEMHRVLKPGGKAVIADLRRDATRESISQAVNGSGLNWFNRFNVKVSLRFLRRRAYTRREFEQFAAQTDFSGVEVREGGIGLEVWLEKGRPEGT